MTATKVTFVSSHAQLGGSEVYLETLCKALDRSSVRSVIALEDGPLVSRLESAGFSVDLLSTSGRATAMARSAFMLGRLVREQGPDVVHANGIKAAALMALAQPVARTPFVWVKHDFSWDGWLGTFVASRAARVVGVSEAVLQHLPASVRARSSVVPNGTSFQPAPRDLARLNLDLLLTPGDGPVIGLVGRFHPVKGHLELIEAAPRILKELPAARFVFVGGDDPSFPAHREVVARAVEDAGLAGAFFFFGHRSDLAKLIGGFDIGVLPSIVVPRGGREGSPYSLIEMMSAGVPVVAYDHGGIPEVMGGDAGVLVPPGDRVGLAEAIVRLLEDDAERLRIAQGGKRRVGTRFSVSKMTREMERIYGSCRRAP